MSQLSSENLVVGHREDTDFVSTLSHKFWRSEISLDHLFSQQTSMEHPAWPDAVYHASTREICLHDQILFCASF